MVGRLLRVTGTVLVIAAAFVTPVLATSAPASADTVINGCTIVSNPTPTNFTNCPGANLAFASLSGDDLSYANLSSASLAGADLSNANLFSANLSDLSSVFCAGGHEPVCFGTHLSRANLTDANLTNASLASCQTVTSFFGQLTICGAVDLSGADLSGVNLTGATLGACLNGPCASVNLNGANLTGATLTGADLTGTILIPSDQPAIALAGSAGAVVTWPTPPSLPGATPGSCSPRSGSTFPLGFTTVTCQVLDDHGDVATGTFTIVVTQVPCQKLAGCNLPFFDLHDVNLADANFMGANLSAATLVHTNLQDANLKGANLTASDLFFANLDGANLEGANLTHAFLNFASVSADTNFNGVTWNNTNCPDGTLSNNDGGTCVGHL